MLRNLARWSPKAASRPQISMLAACVAAIAILTWSGTRSVRLKTGRQAELVRARSTLETFAALRRRYEPAVAAESIAWRRAWMDVQDLGVIGDERLGVTQTVARAAEAAGLADVKVLIAEDDTPEGEKRLSTEGVQSTLAPFSLEVECRGGLQAVVTFLGQLPPSVSPTRLNLVRADKSGPHRISLAVYELTFTNGVPFGWSSLERSPAGAGGVGRPGG